MNKGGGESTALPTSPLYLALNSEQIMQLKKRKDSTHFNMKVESAAPGLVNIREPFMT